ncbi:flagellar biosynthetic protein FliO [Peribacillus saganii]|uniref:Flagellar protein n=1 Tax=Peribacillus saganii TaxID=2303992 RepID=A0A372LSY6_9BACI|nr:flagellar biosynthetic protein FliO [Peribacillus saganii]RFU71298.1 flagellar biosynthetic protein FliO [Peribacillus saganii]
MYSIKKLLLIILVTAVSLHGMGNTAHAAQLDKSVKEWYKSPESDKEEKKGEETPSAPGAASSAGLTFWDFLRMIFATVFVVALLYFMLKFINKKSRAYQKANYIENLGGTSLGANRSIQLIKVGGRVLVVGVGENIQLLKEIADESDYNELIKEHNEKLERLVQPSDFITKLLQKKKHSESGDKGFSFELKKQLEELAGSRKKLKDELDNKGRGKE